jgi:hypothetical protein
MQNSQSFFFHWAIWARSTHNNNPTNMPGVNSKMATKPDPINDEETAETVNVIDRLNEENAACQQERDAALAEVASLKSQYEPPDGVLLTKVLRLECDYETSLMRVTVRTGGSLLLELVPRRGRARNWMFDGGNTSQEFEEYGHYEIYLQGDGNGEHECLVSFSKPATVEITVITEHDGWYGAGPDKTTITEVGDSPAVTLALGKRKREDEQQ